MNISKQTVLLFQPSRFQAEVWHFFLEKYNIIVIWEEKYNDTNSISYYLRTLKLQPDLLIIDFKIHNSDEICKCFQQYYPESKIILTIEPHHECLSSIRYCTINQGIDEVVTNFQQENLLDSVISNINTVFYSLNYPPAQEKEIVELLDYFEHKNVSILPKKNQLQQVNKFIYHAEKIITKIFVNNPSFWLLIVIILISTFILNTTSLFLIAPRQKNQSPISTSTTNPETIVQTQINTLKEVEEVPQGTFNYGGSTTWASIRKIANSQITKEYPKFNLNYLSPIHGTPGSGTGIRMLLEGKLDFAQSSRSIKQVEQILAHAEGFTLREYHIAIDAIAVAVHPALQVPGLTIEELRKIYLGQIINWKEVNGPDLKIVPFSRKPKDGGTPDFFRHHILQHHRFSRHIKYVDSTTEGLRQVADTPGGIYYASAPQIIPQCTVKALPIANTSEEEFIAPYVLPAVAPENCPQQRNKLNLAAIRNSTYPITRYLSVIVKEDGTLAQQGGEAYTKLLFTKQIQQLIEKAGFVSIN